jgi:hypothetical protein
MEPIKTIYIIDSSALINLRTINPIDIYKTPWERLGELIACGRLITHSQVKDEITEGDDFLVDWIKEQDREYDWVYSITEYQNKLLPEIQDTYPYFIKPENEHDADPFVVALALEKINIPPLQSTFETFEIKTEYVILSNEKSAKNRNLENPYEVVKIPDFCALKNISCVQLFGLFRRERWEF